MMAKSIMSADLQFVFARTRVSVLQRILKTTAHNAYPVVSVLEREDIGGLSVNDVSNSGCRFINISV